MALDLNASECLREVTGLVSTTILNVCTGDTTTIPTSLLDQMGIAMLCLAGLFFLGMTVSVVRDLLRGW